MTKYYSDDEFGHEEVETQNENKTTVNDIEYIDVNVLLDELDDLVQYYANEEYSLACIRSSDYLFPVKYKVNYKHNKKIYELSKNMFYVIQKYIDVLDDEDVKMFENATTNVIYSRIMKCINFRYL